MEELRAALAAIAGAEHVEAPPPARYLHDATITRGLRGQAGAVVRPGDAEEVRRVVAWCYERGVPIVPRGGGSGLAGGAVPLDERAVVLSLERLTRVRSFVPELWRMNVEAGVLTAHVQRLARESGLWFPPDPGAAEQSQIGGNVATNAGGPHAFRYGQTGAWVTGVEAVVAPGELVRFGGPVRKDVAGYDLKDMMAGSEGTLGVITAVWLRLIPAPPASAVVAAFFDSEHAGCDAVLEVIGNGLRPAALEFLDATSFAAAAATYPGAAPSAPAFVLIAEMHESTDEIAELLGGAADRPDPAALWRWRDTVHGAVTSLRGGKLSEDVAVPVERLAEALERLRQLGEAHGLETCAWGHAGDGNIHATFMVAPDEAERPERAVEELFSMALDLGGTVTGEHGIGWLKRGHVPAAAGLHAAVKAAFDPDGLLNPGKKS
ncbi:MAG: glycolate oxidase [Thermoleophilaceae bacterium]|nr:glycolate oxidase [Thermoleophilaceae bacterium]